MNKIHGTAIVSDFAILGSGVSIGPFAVIGAAKIGQDCVIHPHVVIADGVTIGNSVEVFPGAFLGKEPKGAGATSRTPIFGRRIEIGDGCSIGPHCVIYYDVIIGSFTLLGDGASIREQCRVGSNCIISRYVTINYNTLVGDRVKVMDMTHLTGNMTIADGAFVSTGVSTANDNVVTSGYSDDYMGPKIGSAAVIGAGAVLLPGVSIGAASFVAAGAVVTRNVESGAIVVGTPARPRSGPKQ
jgi:acetyltransferase-like isoleucine patch superfamily enzyme